VYTCSGAAHGGHLELLQWARAQGAHWDKSAVIHAAGAQGNPALLQWALDPSEE